MPQSKKNGATEHFQGAYIPKQRYRWVTFEENDADEGDIAFRAKIRAHLTADELEPLVWTKETPMAEMYELFAPLVTDWNAATLDDNGDVVQVEPPASGGAKQFEAIPLALFFQIVVEIKQKSVQPVDPKRWNPSVATHARSNDGSTANA